MIPKIIHYCWLSDDPLPDDLQVYMRTWKQVLYDYDFMLWDRKRFDLNTSSWTLQAFENKKYAFAADYIRLYALYNYGGIYLDTDVEVLKSYNSLLSLDFMVGLDHNENAFEMATIGCCKGHPIIGRLLEIYREKRFVNPDGSFNLEPMPAVVQHLLEEINHVPVKVKTLSEALQVQTQGRIPVFPRTYFCPQNWYDFKLNKDDNTYSIHHYKGTWLPDDVRREREILRRLGPIIPRIWRKLQQWFKRH